MFNNRDDVEVSNNNGEITHNGSNSSDHVQITVNSSEEGSRGGTTNMFNMNHIGLGSNVRSTLPPGQSIFLPRLSGYGHSNLKAPLFDNNPFSYLYFKNKLHHYLLMLGIYSALSDNEISETTDMDLYLAIANCLSEQSLDLVSSQAFGQGLKAYRLLDQKFLGNADAREAKTMIDITNITQFETEDLVSYLDRFEVLKSRLDEFKTINKCNFFTILCIKGLHPKYATFKNIICTGKTPTWELFKEKLESHSAMMSLDRQKSGKIMNVTNHTPKIVKRGGRNFKRFVDTNSRKCLNCFGRSHTTKNCHSLKWCHNCSNASHNTAECRLKHKFTIQANQGTQYHPEQPRSSYPQNQKKTQSRGRGNRPQFAKYRGGRGRFSKPKQQSVNTISERPTFNEYRDFENEYATNLNMEPHYDENDSDNNENNTPRAYNTNGNMFL